MTFSFQLVSVLLISVTFYTYLVDIVFSCDLAFNCYATRPMWSVWCCLIAGKQEPSGVCDDVSEHFAEHHGRIQCTGAAPTPGSSALDHADDDEHSESHWEIQTTVWWTAASLSSTPAFHGVINRLKHYQEDWTKARYCCCCCCCCSYSYSYSYSY